MCNAVLCSADDCNSLVPVSHLKILSQNIRSINANFLGLVTLLERIKIPCEIIVLSECWLSCNDVIPILTGYNYFKTLISYNQNDGVVVYLHESLPNIKVREPNVTEFNCLLITSGTDFAVISIYRPFTFKDPSKFLTDLDILLSELKSYSNIFIIGDINIDIAASNLSSYAMDYLELLAHHGLFPGHNIPTHGTTCLDHTMLKTYSAKALVLETTVTDHYAILLAPFLSNNTTSLPRFYNKLDEDKLSLDLTNVNLDSICDTNDPNLATKYLIERIRQLISNNSKTVYIPRRRRLIKAWITTGILRCMRHRDNLHKKLKKDPQNQVLKISYKRYRNFCTNLLRKAKIDYEKLEFTKAGKNSKKVWNVVKNITNIGKPQSSANYLLQLKEDKSESIDAINYYFANIGRHLSEKILSYCDPLNHFHLLPQWTHLHYSRRMNQKLKVLFYH